MLWDRANERGLCDEVTETELIRGVTYKVERIESCVKFKKDLVKI